MSKVSLETPVGQTAGHAAHEVRSENVVPLQVLSPEGEVVNAERMPKLSDDQLKEILRRLQKDRKEINIRRL